jgi:hypothetical protein
VDAAARGGLAPGARVLDRATGVLGVVAARAPGMSVQGHGIVVQLDTGETVQRLASVLVPRPTPPRV